MRVCLGSITELQILELEFIFAEYKGEDGWVIPDWLVQLKDDVILQEYGPNTK